MEPFSVDLLSDEFDPVLVLVGPGLDDGFHADDNGAGGCNSRITVVFPETAEYRLIVTSLDETVGAFRLIASEEPSAPDPDPCNSFDDINAQGNLSDVAIVGDLVVDETRTAAMGEADYVFQHSPLQAWTLDGMAGDQLVITLTSDEFDTYLLFDGPGFSQPLVNDDNIGTDSSICVELPRSGTYRVFAGAYSREEDYVGAEYRVEVLSSDGTESCVFKRSLDTVSVSAPIIGVNDQQTGSLNGELIHPFSERPIDAWKLRGEPGTLVYVDVISHVFDAYLYALGDEIGVRTADDFGDSTHSRMELSIPNSGSVTLLVSAYHIGGEGEYLLRTSTTDGED
ncbi:MAG: hypothetical protein OXQ31_13240 [Spirochaetaceae bacterium]|nr:hypothetical protein [Spirochaetaceae bacterium]